MKAKIYRFKSRWVFISDNDYVRADSFDDLLVLLKTPTITSASRLDPTPATGALVARRRAHG